MNARGRARCARGCLSDRCGSARHPRERRKEACSAERDEECRLAAPGCRKAGRLYSGEEAKIPVTDIYSVLAVGQEIYDNWTQADAVRAIVIAPDITRAVYAARLAALRTRFESVTGRTIAVQAARIATRSARDPIRIRLEQYRFAVAACMAGTYLARATPLLPHRECSIVAFIESVRAFLKHWDAVDEACGADPLVLAVGFTRADLAALLQALLALLDDQTNLEMDLRMERDARDQESDALIALMKAYRIAATAALWDHPELVKILPVLRRRRFATPEGVELSATWLADRRMVGLSWTRSTAGGPVRYLVRCRPGSDAPTEAHPLIATITDPEQTTLTTSAGFTPTQATVTYRIWVVDAHEHQAASNPASVTREE